MKGTVEVQSFESQALKGNPLSDPATRRVVVYLPAAHSTGKESFPVAYFLHGFGSGVDKWLAQANSWGLTVPERLDQLIESGKVPPFIGVFVDGWTALGGAQWMNSEATGRYSDYLARDVVSWVDQHYRTVKASAGRALIGHSSGGYGAMVNGRDHHDIFGHIACHAGDSAFEYAYLGDFWRAAGPLLQSGGLDKWFPDFVQRARETKMKGDDFSVINTVAMAAAYSPKKGAPLNLELPFDQETARLRQDVWAKWLENDPVRFIPKHLASFKKLRSIFLDAGSRDEFGLRWGTRMMAEELKKGGVDFLHEEFDDGHRDTSYRYDRSVLYLVPRMTRS
ncbi:MAG: alpha/beta hydrolase [Myxococcaceae bacterium]